MADKYLDTQAYTYATTPTWGTAQEGDGTLTTAATPSTASVVFTGIPSSGAIAVLGVTLSPTWATSASVCADNLATAINAATGTATGPASFTTKSQVRNHIYARGPSTGAAADTCEIMTRQGSASHAGLIAVTHTLNNVSSSATINFSGGAGGCWGWLFGLASTIWPSGSAANEYGLWANGTVFTGALNAGDIVHMRTKNGTDIVTIYSTNADLVIPSRDGGVTFLADSGVKWSGDNGTLTVRFSHGNTSRSITSGSGTSGNWMALVGKPKTGRNKNFVLELSGDYTREFLNFSRSSMVEHVYFKRVSSTSYPLSFVLQSQNATGDQAARGTQRLRFLNCVFSQEADPVAWGAATALNDYNCAMMEFIGCEWYYTTASTLFTGAMMAFPAGNTLDMDLVFDSCTITGAYAGSSPFGGLPSYGSLTGRLFNIQLRNCNLGNATNIGSPLLATAALGYSNTGYAVGVLMPSTKNCLSIMDTLPGRRFMQETHESVLEWNPSTSWPVLNANLPEAFGAVTKMAYRFTTNPSTVETTAVQPKRAFGRVKWNTLGAAVRTLKLNLLVDEIIETAYGALTSGDVQLSVSYIDTTGVIRSESSYLGPGANETSLASSTASWSVTYYDVGGTVRHDYTKREVSLTTAYAVKDATEMFIEVRVGLGTPTGNDWYFFCPEILLT